MVYKQREISIENKLLKTQKIKQSLVLTKAKRKNQICKSFELKIQSNKLNAHSYIFLTKLFLEAKHIYNNLISGKDIKDLKDEVLVKLPNGNFRTRKLRYITSQMKQGIFDKFKQNIFNLSKKKKKGYKVGKLKFKREYNSIYLKQYGNTYKIEGNKLRLQGLKQRLKLNGVEQIYGYELASACLIKNANGFFLKVTCYKDKNNIQSIQSNDNKGICGIDIGLKTQLTISDTNGTKTQLVFDKFNGLDKKIRNRQRKVSRAKKKSRNRYKQRLKYQKLVLQLDNLKQDRENKIISYLRTNYKTIILEDINLRNWQKLWGKKSQSIRLGRLISTLKQVVTTQLVNRFFASTQLCSHCGHKQSMGLEDRIYHCEKCGMILDRDENASNNILFEGLDKLGLNELREIAYKLLHLPLEQRKVKSVERIISAFNYISCGGKVNYLDETESHSQSISSGFFSHL